MAEPATLAEYEDALADENIAGVITRRGLLEDTEMDITPMIDCTFLLLIFFLLTFKSDEGATIPLPPAKYGIPVSSKNAVILTIIKDDGDRPAKVFTGNTTDSAALVASADLKVLEDEVTAYVDKEATTKRKTYVLIRAAADVKHRDVARVARAACRVADIDQLHVAVLEVQ